MPDDKESQILVPHRCVGRVFGKKPACYYGIQTSATLGYISFPINNSVFTYKIKPLVLAWISEPVASDVRVVVRDKTRIFAADDDGIDVLNFNGTRLKRLLQKKLKSPINFLISMGNILVCIEENGFISVVDVKTGNVLVEIETPSSFVISSAIHPDTFYNKIVLGSTDGRIRIVNINTAKLVHEFQQNHLFNCEITCIVQSPAKDVLAFGMEDGNVHLRNLKSGDILFTFRQDGSVTGISFRTDGIETMATTNSAGTIALWNLNERLLIGQKIAAHSGKIHSVFFLLGQPNMITCGEDNKIARWFMETEIALPVPSKIIEGHKGEVTAIKFATDTSILSSGIDGHVRKFNIYRGDRISQLGVAREVKKKEISKDRFIDVRLEPIIDMKLEKMREHVWDNVACVHKDSPIVSTWSSRRYTKGTHLFCHDRFTKDGRYLSASVTAVEITNSGDLCFVGYSSGHIDAYNMQSGKFKFTFENPKFKSTKKESTLAHKAQIVAIFSYLNSRDVVTVSANGTIGWWMVESAAKLKKFIDCGEKVSVATFSRESRLLAIGLHEVGNVHVLDADTGATARVFKNIARDESDFALLEFSNNSAYLLTADTSGIIRLIDLKSATLIGSIRCSNVCKKAVFSPNDLYVATCHENQSEIFIWTNRSKFASIYHSTRLDENLPVQALSCFAPNIIEDEIDFELNDDEEEETEGVETRVRRFVIDDDESDIEVLNESIEIDVEETADVTEEKGLFTLSGQPSHRWAVLPYIDVIKSRNTIRDVVKKPINVPFFLESTPNEMDIIVADQTRKIALADRSGDEIWTEWARKLSGATVTGDYIVCFNSLTDLSTPQIDLEIRSLPTSLTVAFVRMILAKLGESSQLDFVQAILCTFIRVHRDRIAQIDTVDENAQSENQENIAVPLAASDLTKELEELHKKLIDSTAKFEQIYTETLPVLKMAQEGVKEHRLEQDQELRFEVGKKEVVLEIVDGEGEIFGLPLKRYKKYTLQPGFRGAIFTYSTATIEIVGGLEIEYIASKADQPMLIYANIHGGLMEMRNKAKESKDQTGPIVMITGPKNVGKTSLAKILCNYAIREVSQLVYVDLDVNMNSVFPGCISMVGVEQFVEPVYGFDTSNPFVYSFGHFNALDNQKLYDLMMQNMSAVFKRKLQTDRFRTGGAIIDTCSWNKGDYYSSILKAAELFEVNVVIVLDHERMFADLTKDLPNTVKIIHAPKSGGAEALTNLQESDCRRDVIQKYFYGTRLMQLFPRFYEFSYDCPVEKLELRIARIGVEALPASCLPYGMAADENQTMVEYVEYSSALNNRIIALIEDVKTIGPSIINHNVIGFVLIKEVNTESKFVSVLLSTEAPIMSTLGLLSDAIFLDDVISRM
ncbi:hypothetical protein M3Y97_00777500 [Aphelenchoides bicaudatus]|nr:hypothetical protein M3Y97_00777500 [Aphelenchoides bicaudatus]